MKELRNQGIADREARLKKFGGSTENEMSRIGVSDVPHRANGGRVGCYASGGGIEGAMAPQRLDRAKPKAKKKPATTHVNVIVAPQGGGDDKGPPLVAGGGGPAGLPGGAPPSLPPLSAGPAGPMPPMPMRKDGGAVKQAKLTYPIKDGSGSGKGRLQEAAFEKKQRLAGK